MSPIAVGDIFKAVGEYSEWEAVEIFGPCRCMPFVWHINHMGEEEPGWVEHYHITAKHMISRSEGHFNGIAEVDGEIVNVFLPRLNENGDKIHVYEIIRRAAQPELF